MNNVLECLNLSRSFGSGEMRTEVIKDVNLAIKKGERVAIVGSSGCGKSTLLHLLGGLDKPDAGEIYLSGEDIVNMSNNKITRFRNKKVGFIYQFHHLLPEFSALENVAMPLWIGNQDKEKSLVAAKELLCLVGLDHRIEHRPGELSGGERQRVAIARAMVNKPEIILADEPTGNLDTDSAGNVVEVMNELNVNFGTSLLVVTHDKSLADKMDRVLTLSSKHLS